MSYTITIPLVGVIILSLLRNGGRSGGAVLSVMGKEDSIKVFPCFTLFDVDDIDRGVVSHVMGKNIPTKFPLVSLYSRK